jgi:hypothetical protein
MHHQAVRHARDVTALAADLGFAEGDRVTLVRDVALDRAVRLLVLEEDDWVGIVCSNIPLAS